MRKVRVMSNTKTVMLCGVGGQGALLAADILARCAMACGEDVKLSEIHGMAQRGGAVTTIIRIGDEVASMVADLGCVDCLVSFETTEALRNLPYLSQNGSMFVSDVAIQPLPVLAGKASMPSAPRKTLESLGAAVIPAELLAKQAGSEKAVNVVLLGALSTKLPYPETLWREIIASRVPEKFKEINLTAFELGRSWANDKAQGE